MHRHFVNLDLWCEQLHKITNNRSYYFPSLHQQYLVRQHPILSTNTNMWLPSFFQIKTDW